ncbi:RRXRR domain-containing protein [Sutterella sp.]|uniref:RRXRR domain-containing protein n=1 Tax=Sutterella sp. TaxID=1981025 RepID=UPI0026E05FA1|nr:RRXRR domain-containing protein [Sutterella sp.]MDO5531950.1 RRXRR domain-containing protein [Sutterella sp.]
MCPSRIPRVTVLNSRGKPLMPCSPSRARKLIRSNKASVLRRDPFTIQMIEPAGARPSIASGEKSGDAPQSE